MIRKHVILISALITLVSCSGTQTSLTDLSERGPASLTTCSDFVKNFFQSEIKTAGANSKVNALLENKVLAKADLAFLQDTEIAAFLVKQKKEREEIEADVLLIKKKYQHMGPSQVIAHFKLLRNSCHN